MFTLLASAFLFAADATPTVTYPAPGVPGGVVVIQRDRAKMKQKDECPKHVVIVPKH